MAPMPKRLRDADQALEASDESPPSTHVRLQQVLLFKKKYLFGVRLT